MDIVISVLNTAGDIIVALGALFMALYTFSKKFRNWFNDKISKTESMQKLDARQTKLEKQEKDLENSCILRTQKIDKMCDQINEFVNKLEEKIDKDNKSTILSLKCQILDICSRASRYGGITAPDKQLLCELYREYVDVWKQNHYVKSEAKKVIETALIIDDYQGQV